MKAPKERWYLAPPSLLPCLPSSPLRHSFAINLANRREKNISVARGGGVERSGTTERTPPQKSVIFHRFPIRLAPPSASRRSLIPRIMQMEKEGKVEESPKRKGRSERSRVLRLNSQCDKNALDRRRNIHSTFHLVDRVGFLAVKEPRH